MKKIINKLGYSLIGLAASYFLLGPIIKYKTTYNYMCPISASTKTETDWFFYNTEKVNTSELEMWIKKNHRKDFKPNFVFYGGNGHYITGQSCLKGRLPLNYALNKHTKHIVENSTDEQLSELVKALESQQKDQIKQKIHEAFDRYFESLEK